jgi:hypothetical protein
MTGMRPGIIGPDCIYCGHAISGVGKAVKGCGTYIGWRHKTCRVPINKEHYARKVAEAREFVAILRSGDRSSLHPALRWGR